jgi:hypothetical protein
MAPSLRGVQLRPSWKLPRLVRRQCSSPQVIQSHQSYKRLIHIIFQD